VTLPLIIDVQSAAPATLMSFDEPSVWRMARSRERQIGQLIEPLDDLGPARRRAEGGARAQSQLRLSRPTPFLAGCLA